MQQASGFDLHGLVSKEFAGILDLTWGASKTNAAKNNRTFRIVSPGRPGLYFAGFTNRFMYLAYAAM